MRAFCFVFLLCFCSAIQAQTEAMPPVNENNVPFAEPHTDTVYYESNVDRQAEFPGGTEALRMYLKQNIKYPSDAKKSNISGKVQIGFVIEKNGKVTRIKIKRPLYASLDEEAVRVVSCMPDWKPAMRGEKVVKQMVLLPINFKLP